MTAALIALLAFILGALLGWFIYGWIHRESEREEAPKFDAKVIGTGLQSPKEPECEHDWREDPQGWKDDEHGFSTYNIFVGMPPDVIKDQSLTIVCLKCTAWEKKWRKVADVKDWPAAEVEP